MDIDLIAGLVKPKVSPTERPQPETAAPPDAAFPDFTTLLNSKDPDSPAAQLDAATPEISIPPASALVKDAEQDAAPVDDSAAPDSDEIDKVGNAELPSLIATTPSELGGAPYGMAPEPILTGSEMPSVIGQTAPIPAFEAAATIGISTSAKLEQKANDPEQKPILRARVAPDAKPEQPQKTEVLPTMQHPDAAKAQPVPIMPVAGLAAQFRDEPSRYQNIITPDTPKADVKAMPANLMAKAGNQTPVLSAPMLGLVNTETAIDTPGDTHFSIKINHHLAEITPTQTSAPKTAPVASQISAQLPQMLTRAEKQTVELRLDPPELGRVTIHISTHDQQVTAHVVADRPDTVDLMRRHADLLSSTLAHAGFSQADLSFQQGQGQQDETEIEQFQHLSEVFESDELANAPRTVPDQDGRLDIRL